MRTKITLPGKKIRNLAILFCFLFFVANFAAAEKLLLTLSLPSSTVRWQDEFVLTLEIYGAPSTTAPEVSIAGMEQFPLKGTGKNLLQIPRGKTVKWILTYTMTANQDGTFKIGPARIRHEGKYFYSNTLFLTVKAPQRPKTTPAQPTTPTGPRVRSASDVGDKILILMDAPKERVYRTEGIPVTLRLLSQLPVENLRFKDEADFPGFLKYDFPFYAHPKAAWIDYQKSKYAAYELQKFLVFPLKEGSVRIPPVVCELRVRVPTSAYAASDLVFNLERSSDSLSLNVLPAPPSAVVGNFLLRNEIVSDFPHSKTVRLILEGEGELSTFDFPEIPGSNFRVHRLSTSTNSSIKNQKLRSRKEEDIEVTPAGKVTDILLPEVRISQFDPSIRRVSILRLPPLRLLFVAPGEPRPRPVPLPTLVDVLSPSLPLLTLLSTLLLLLRNFRSSPRKIVPELKGLFSRKNPNLRISKNAAQKFYRNILIQIISADGSSSWMDSLRRHLPAEDWLPAERAFRRLESTAFSQARGAGPTYGELLTICERVEKRWKP